MAPGEFGLYAHRPKANDTRSTFHDDVQGTTIWPELYDGRAIIGDSYQDHVSGASLEENVAKFKAAKDVGDNSRLIHWS